MEQHQLDLTGPMSTIIYQDGIDFLSYQASYQRLLYPLLEYNETYFTPPSYIPKSIVNGAHSRPRFGNSNLLDGVIDGNREESRDYVTGVIMGSIIIAIVAIVWFMAIICLKIAGAKRVGFLAGRFTRPTSGIEKEGDGGVEIVLEQDQPLNDVNNEELPPTNHSSSATIPDPDPQAMKNFGIRVGVVRSIFVLSGIAVIISGGLFYGKGAVSFRNAIHDVHYGIDMAQEIGEKAMLLAENVTAAADDVEEQIQPQENEGEQICGLDSELTTQIRSLYNELNANVDQLKATLDENVGSISSDIQDVMNTLEDVEKYLEWSDIFFTVLIIITVVIITLIVAMLVGVVFAWQGVSNSFTKCIQYALIWPLFIFSLVLSWIFATLFLAAGLAGADFCVTPDKYVEDFLYAHEDMFDGMLFGFLIYYVTGCKIVPPGMEYIVQASAELKSVMIVTHELTSVLADLPIESLVLLCDLTVEQATVLKQITTLGHTIIHLLDRTFVGLREVISCQTMNPVYTTFVHEAFCKEAVVGMQWIFFTTLFIAIFSMMLIMTRAALYPIRDRGVLKSIGGDDGNEVVKYTEQPLEPEKSGVQNADNDTLPFQNFPESVYDRATNVDAPAHGSAYPDSGSADSGGAGGE